MIESLIALGGMAILLIVRESETFYLKSTTTNLLESKMSYTKNEIALSTLIGNINNTFSYIGEDGDDVDQFEIDQLHKFVDQFASQVTISDSQGE